MSEEFSSCFSAQSPRGRAPPSAAAFSDVTAAAAALNPAFRTSPTPPHPPRVLHKNAPMLKMYFRLWGKVFCTHFAFISGNIKVYIFTPLKHCNVTLLKQHNCGQYHGEDFLGEKVARKSKKRSAARRAAFVPRHKKSRIGC